MYIEHVQKKISDALKIEITVMFSSSYCEVFFCYLFDILFQIHFDIHWEINPIDCQGIWKANKISLCVEQVLYRTSHRINIGKRSN